MAQVSSVADEQLPNALSTTKTILLRISRFNPESDDSNKFMEFNVSYEKWTTVLEAILDVKKHHDHSVAVRYSCRQATCGSCGMLINGKPRLACFTKISELDSNVVTVEPMNNFPVIRDLAVKFERLFDTHQKIKPYLGDIDFYLEQRQLENLREAERKTIVKSEAKASSNKQSYASQKQLKSLNNRLSKVESSISSLES